MCKYSYKGLFTEHEYKCSRKEYKDGFCIFHCDKDKEKFTEEDIKKFNEEFWKEFERQEKDENVKEFDFRGFKFPDGFSFAKKEFKKPVNFTNATFNGETDFSEAKFTSEAYFSGATFNGEANFFQTTFNGEANFFQTTFNGEANFLDATFNSEANFSNATFTSRANFLFATFNSEAYFSGVTFSNMTYFSFATFNGEAYFSRTTFNGEAYFLQTTFNGEAYFLQTTFNGKANFSEAKFTSEANFSEATFNGKANFSNATFNGKANFSNATFGSKAHFSNATFNGNVIFKSTTFQESAKFIGSDKNKIFRHIADFSYSYFKTPEEVEFVNVDLSKAFFIHCKNIDRIGRFEGVEWSEKELWGWSKKLKLCGKWSKKLKLCGKWSEKLKLSGKRKVIYDEIKEENSEKNYEYIAEIYRKLRLNYERDLRFVEAGDFYIGEMEMRRKDAKSKFKLIRWIERNLSPIAFYKYFSYYGERYTLPLIWSVIIITIFSVSYSHSPNIPFFPDSFFTSIQVFFQFPPASVKNLEGLVFSERVLGVFFGALFVLALRRKFKKTTE